MKRLLSSTSVLLVIVLFAACKKDVSTNNSIIGTWEIHHEHGVFIDSNKTPISTRIEDTTFIHGHAPILQFRADNTFSSSTSSGIIADSGTYTAVNGTITAMSGQNVRETLQYVVNGNSLTLTQAGTASGYSVDIVADCTRQ